MIATAKKHKKLAAVVLAGAVLLGGGGGALVTRSNSQSSEALSAADAARQQAEIIRLAAIQSCEASKHPGGVRFILARTLRKEARRIAEQQALSAHLPPSYFPGIPPDQFRLLQRHQAAEAAREEAENYQQAHELRHFDCAAQYPAVPLGRNSP